MSRINESFHLRIILNLIIWIIIFILSYVTKKRKYHCLIYLNVLNSPKWYINLTYCNTLRRYEFYGMNEERFQKVYSRQKLNEPIKYDELEILYQTTCIKIDLPNMDFKRQIRCWVFKITYWIRYCLRCTISDGLFLYYRHE